MGQTAATGYVPDKGLPVGYQPEVEEYPAMASSKVTTGARLSDDDGLWAGESRHTFAPAIATAPSRHASADPPRFDFDYSQARWDVKNISKAVKVTTSQRAASRARRRYEGGCPRQGKPWQRK